MFSKKAAPLCSDEYVLFSAFEEADDNEPELPEWLMEVPEDLDVCIAQRHFEEAYNLLERAREFLDKNTATDPVITDIRYVSFLKIMAYLMQLLKWFELNTENRVQFKGSFYCQFSGKTSNFS